MTRTAEEKWPPGGDRAAPARTTPGRSAIERHDDAVIQAEVRQLQRAAALGGTSCCALERTRPGSELARRPI